MKNALILTCVLVAGCSKKPPDETADGLVIKSADPETGIEARYREGEHALVLRSTKDKGEVLDERGHSMTALATLILEPKPLRDDKGALVVPVHGMFANVQQLGASLRLARHAIRELREAIPSETAESDAFRKLAHQTVYLRRALTATRLALLEEWGNVVHRSIQMTPEEHTKFFAILNRQAVALAGNAGAKNRGTSTKQSAELEIEALLGADRYGHYKAKRKQWVAPIGELALAGVP